VPAVSSSIIEPIGHQFEALIPPVLDEHPLGCHRPRVPDRVVFDKLVQVLVLGAAYVKAVDGCIVKAPCGGEAAGRSPVDRGKQGTKRSVLVDGNGIPIGCVVAGANCHDSPLLAPTLEKLDRFEFDLPERITVHLDAGYDSSKTRDLLDVLGCDYVISKKGEPLQAGNPMGRRENELLAYTRVPETPDLHRGPSPRDRRVHRPRHHDHHHKTPHPRSLDPLPLGQPTHPKTMTYRRDL